MEPSSEQNAATAGSSSGSQQPKDVVESSSNSQQVRAANLFRSVTVVSRCRDSRQTVARLLKEEVLALAVEAVYTDRDGDVLTLVQLSTAEGDVFIFNIQQKHKIIHKGHLQRVLESDRVLKLIHNCRWASQAFRSAFNVTLRNVFDTLVAHMTIEAQHNKVPHLVPSINVEQLCTLYQAPVNPRWEETTSPTWEGNIRFWDNSEGLTDVMQYHAAADVCRLHAVYARQVMLLQVEYKWLLDEMTEEFLGHYSNDDELGQAIDRRLDRERAFMVAAQAHVSAKGRSKKP